MVTTRAAKRRQLAENYRTVAASTPDKPKNTFLKLPQEIRDQIYTFIFANNAMEFCWKYALLLCDPSPMHSGRPSSLQGTRGFPSWMLTCKQVLHEVVEFIARTHSIKLVQETPLAEQEMDGAPNPLVISKNGIRTILLYHPERGFPNPPWLRSSLEDKRWYHRINNDFLNTLKQLRVTDIYLELRWTCLPENRIQACTWRYEERIGFLAGWTPYWEGKFRKVAIEITVSYGIQKGSPNEQLIDEAQKLAVQLVGSGSCYMTCIG